MEIKTKFTDFESELWDIYTGSYGNVAAEVKMLMKGDIESEEYMKAYDKLFEGLTKELEYYNASILTLPYLIKLLQKRMAEDNIYMQIKIIALVGRILATDIEYNHTFEDMDDELMDSYFLNVFKFEEIIDYFVKYSLEEIKNISKEDKNMVYVAILAAKDQREAAYMYILTNGFKAVSITCRECCEEYHIKDVSEIKPEKTIEKNWDFDFENINTLNVHYWFSNIAYELGDEELCERLRYVFGSYLCKNCKEEKMVIIMMKRHFFGENYFDALEEGEDGGADIGFNEKDAGMTYYLCSEDLSYVKDIVSKVFGKVVVKITETVEDHFDVILQDGSVITFMLISDTKKVSDTTFSLAGFYSSTPLEDKELLEKIVTQIINFRGVIGVTFQINDIEERTEYIIQGLNAIASNLTAFTLYPNMCLCHPNGRLLIDKDGNTEFSYYTPISQVENEKVLKTKEDEQKKKKSLDVLKELNVPFAEDAEVTVYNKTAVIVDKESLINRAIAMFACCLKSEIYSTYDAKDVISVEKEIYKTLQEQYNFTAHLSAAEVNFLNNLSPDETEIEKYSWRYECIGMIFYILSLCENKKYDELFEAKEIAEIIWKNNFETLLGKAVKMDKKEVLQLQDIYYRLDLSMVKADIKGIEIEGIDKACVYERHYVLNWICNAGGIANWDMVTT